MISFTEIGSWGNVGNQLFQISSVYAHSLRMKTTCLFPENIATKKLKEFFPNIPLGGLPPLRRYPEPIFNYHPIPELNNISLHGYYQSPKYWTGYEKEIRDLLSFRVPITKLINTCSIHLRRGDYTGLSHVYNQLDWDNYYKKAVELLPANKYLVFSDDISAAREVFSSLPNVEFIEGNEPLEDMRLMSSCSSHIIANSSFSWWGAYLGNGPTIAPRKWFTNHLDSSDIYCETWKVLE